MSPGCDSTDFPGEGKTCRNKKCLVGLRCVKGVCERPRKAGQPCARNSDCEALSCFMDTDEKVLLCGARPDTDPKDPRKEAVTFEETFLTVYIFFFCTLGGAMFVFLTESMDGQTEAEIAELRQMASTVNDGGGGGGGSGGKGGGREEGLRWCR